jgi:thioredoxin reductase
VNVINLLYEHTIIKLCELVINYNNDVTNSDYFKIETENTELEKSVENDAYIVTTPISKYYYAIKEGSQNSSCKSKPTESLTSLG